MADDKKTATAPTSKIVQQGKPFQHLSGSGPTAGKPGQYKVTHGVVSFGYAKDKDGQTFGPAQLAYEGAIVELTAEEAGALVQAKTVEYLGPSAG